MYGTNDTKRSYRAALDFQKETVYKETSEHRITYTSQYLVKLKVEP